MKELIKELRSLSLSLFTPDAFAVNKAADELEQLTSGDVDLPEPAMDAPVHAPPASGERAALIADLRLNHEFCPKEVILSAADMLAADALEIADCKRINHMERDRAHRLITEIEALKAQQVAVPQTMMVSTAPSYEFANGWNACIANMLAAPQPQQGDSK